MELLPEYQGLPLEDQLAIMRRKARTARLYCIAWQDHPANPGRPIFQRRLRAT